jgi:hypothetical protein
MKNNVNLVLSALLLFAVLAGIGLALTPPPPPPPPVNQNLGIYDTSIALFKVNGSFTSTSVNGQMACRICHNSTGTTAPGFTNTTLGGVDSRHHGLVQRGVTNPMTNVPFGCQDCHPTNTTVFGNGILLDHACTDCHNSTNFWADTYGARVGNMSRPHHFNTAYDDANIGNPAQARQCDVCHGSFINNYNDSHYIPSYDTSEMITPYAKWKVTNFSQPLLAATLQPGNINVNPPYYSSDGLPVTNKEWGGCESCHLGTTNTSLIANGSYTGTPILPNHDSHHLEILDGNVTINGTILNLGGRTPGATCSWCHVILPGQAAHGGVFLFNFTNAITGEVVLNDLEVRNSTIEHMDAANGSFEPGTVNVTINGTGCEKCHDVQSIHNIQFNYQQNGPAGLGHINNNSDCSGCHDEWLPSDTWAPGPLVPTVDSISPSTFLAGTQTTLTITGANFNNPDGTYPAVVSVDGTQITPTSLTGSQLTVSIPAQTAGTHTIEIVKDSTNTHPTKSKLATLTVMPNIVIYNAKYAKGVGKNLPSVTISGVGFGGTKPTVNPLYYVSFTHSGNQILSSAIVSWNDGKIVVTPPSGVGSGDIVTVETANAGAAQVKIS